MKFNYGWVIVAAGAVITCVAMGAMFALPVYLQPMAEETGWTRAGISGAMTVGFIVMGVAGFGWGILTDRIGARPVVLIAALMLGAGPVPVEPRQRLLLFQIAYGGLVGAAGGAFFAPLISTTLGWFDKNRSLAISLVCARRGRRADDHHAARHALIQTYGWRSSMLFTAIGATVLLAPLSILIRRAPAAAEAPVPAVAGGAPQAKPATAWSALRTPQFIVLAATFFLCCAAHSGPIFHTVSYAMICGASAMAAASIYSVEGVAGLFGRLLFGLLADRIGVRKVIVGGLALQAIRHLQLHLCQRVAALLYPGGGAWARLWRRDAALFRAGARIFQPARHGVPCWVPPP